jgi:DNA replication protein DnaC
MLFFQFVSRRYERDSIIFTSNRRRAWDGVFDHPSGDLR